jgi:thioredoxin-related protein
MALMLLVLLIGSFSLPAASGEEEVGHPDWFKTSFLDLGVDLSEASQAGKTGIMLFFHTPACTYCQALLNTTFADPEVARRLPAGFDVIPLDVLSDVEVRGLDGSSRPAKDFAIREKATFTPTLIFYGDRGRRLLRLVGYASPEKFLTVLDYLQQRRYETQSLRAFLSEQDAPRPERVTGSRTGDPLFMRPPYILDRQEGPDVRPLLVLFERADCNACDRLRQVAFGDPGVRRLLSRFVVVRLDMNDAATGLVTPSGARMRVGEWADSLGLLHAPALVFFDERDREVVRVDSELLIDARGIPVEGRAPEYAGNVAERLRYVLEKGYLEQPQFQQWRRRQAAAASPDKVD